MRVIGGTRKGKTIFAPTGESTRPTADRVREDLFNIISVKKETRFLDLYAGTGAVGIEAMSRGALATFVERDSRSLSYLIKNLKRTDFYDEAVIIKSSVEIAIKNLANNPKFEPFDFIFMDPPFNKNLVSPTLQILEKYDILKKEGMLIVEASKREKSETCFSLVRIKKYSQLTLLFYKKENEGDL